MTGLRNALEIGGLIITTDNSGGIGQKREDLVAVPDRMTARFAARVCLLEQWAADAEPEAVLLHNFSGEASWEPYCEGIRDVFDEIGKPIPPISGSSETNMALRQSALAVTFIGRKTDGSPTDSGDWFTYGTPLSGNAVLEQSEEIASLAKLNEARRQQLTGRIWPAGSGGLLAELQQAAPGAVPVDTPVDLYTSAGPATAVLLQIPAARQQAAHRHFGTQLRFLAPG
ncbi:alpha-ribazole-5-phosphate synthase [Sporosarcina trichiuri]|uniref:alpha-ribazole-5-phosphate synthase n=1 Tax=Sporosarcina trichiuri TaxID=3056445 RepID=UPI0025B5E960|nr:alpha-ribazole-5-phosphate synthase [Sporosarcina sp. 0.2-SM1T-5]WJY26541.1 alpha-ribazole-5-phosphate synthase [Sporosarcina sp. 0.2-SM1T-5]